MVMDLLEGQTLAQLLAVRGRICLEDAAEIFVGVARALQAVHSAGHVHRDVKPENIFICGNASSRKIMAERIRLVDLGVARPINAPVRSMTVYGTPEYMSPEQVSGHSLDNRSDLYSLGVVLFEMLTGKPGFEGATPRDIMLAHIRQPAPELPESFMSMEQGRIMAETVSALLRKDPALRPATALDAAAMIPLDSFRRTMTSKVDLKFFQASGLPELQLR
jgi:serine/threonine-protein kinase